MFLICNTSNNLFSAPPLKAAPAPNLLDDLMGGDTVHNNQMNGNDGIVYVFNN